MNFWLPKPACTLAVGGETATVVVDTTVSVVVPVMAPDAAWIVAAPTLTVVASPAAVMVATFVLEEVQATALVRFCVEPSAYVPVAVNCCGVPVGTEGLAGVTARDDNDGAFPVPVKPTRIGLPKALSFIERVPVRVPGAEGEKVTPIVQLAPAMIPVPQVFVAIAKSPVTPMEETASVVCKLFVSTTF